MLNLKKLRKEKGLTQQFLAEKFDLSQQSIYKYENNLAEPDIATLKELAEFFWWGPPISRILTPDNLWKISPT